MVKIHFLSNSIRMNSGFGNVTKAVALGLRKLGHEISMTGINTAFTMDYSYGIEQWPIDTKYVDETSQLIFNIRRTNPDIMFYVGQLDVDTNHLIRGIFPKTVVYVPVEGKDIPDVMSNDLRNIEKNGGVVVAQCEYGRQEMKKVGVIDPKMIYHGFNPDIFYPMDMKNEKKNEKYESYCYYATDIGRNESDPEVLCKQGCFHCHGEQPIINAKCPYYKEETISILRMMDVDTGKNIEKRWTEREIGISRLSNETKGKFVYGFVGRNFGIRKRIERLVRAYSIIIKDSRQMKDHTILHLHCMPIAIDGINVIKEIAKLGISENVIFSYGVTRSDAWTEEAMARLYNTFDCNVSASSSEGFGLGTLESMACGKANIAPNCSSFIELIGDGEKDKNARGLLAIIGEWQMIPDGSQRVLVNEEHLATMMKKMYVDKKCRERFEENGIQFAKQYTWENVVKQWDKLLGSI